MPCYVPIDILNIPPPLSRVMAMIKSDYIRTLTLRDINFKLFLYMVNINVLDIMWGVFMIKEG